MAEGKNGDKKLTKEQIDAEFDFSRSAKVSPSSDFDKTAELWNSLVERRRQKVGKSFVVSLSVGFSLRQH